MKIIAIALVGLALVGCSTGKTQCGPASPFEPIEHCDTCTWNTN